MTTEAPAAPAAKVATSKVGNLTRDPELRFSASGTAFATFGLAVKAYVPKGEPAPPAVFYEVVTFGTLAEHVSECLVKGDRVVVGGVGQLEHWTGKDGTERTTKKIIADGVGPDLRFTAVPRRPTAASATGRGRRQHRCR